MPPYVLTVRAAFRGVAARLLAIGRTVLETDVVDAAGTFVQSWAQTLAVGNTSGGQNPTISTGDSLTLLGTTNWSLNVAGNVLRFVYGASVRYQMLSNAIELSIPEIRFNSSIGLPTIRQAGTDGAPMAIKAQDGTGIVTGGSLTLAGGDNATGNGGTAILRGGTGTGTAGTAEVQHDDGRIAVLVEGNGSAHTGGQAIRVDQNGLAFFDGTTADKPIVNGGKGGNPALTSLCSVLASMGLITDNTT